MTNSSTRADRVATAAPTTPRAGAPRLPKMNTQLRKALVSMDAPKMIMPSLGFSMERWAPTYTPARLLKI